MHTTAEYNLFFRLYINLRPEELSSGLLFVMSVIICKFRLFFVQKIIFRRIQTFNEVEMRLRTIQAYPAFCGKVHLFTDFDGTYCPEKHAAMHNPEQNPQMLKYCKKNG